MFRTTSPSSKSPDGLPDIDDSGNETSDNRPDLSPTGHSVASIDLITPLKQDVKRLREQVIVSFG